MSFRFEQTPAPPELAPWLDLVWFARGRIDYAREHIAPTGSTVAVLNFGDPIRHATAGDRACAIEATDGWLCGPHDRPSLNEPHGETHCYGVVAGPAGCRVLFGADPRALRGRVAPLEAWVRGPGLHEILGGLGPEEGLPRLLEALAATRALEPGEREQRVARAVTTLEAAPDRPIADVAAEAGVSHAYLDREFRRVVGIGPRRLAAILRVRALLAGLDVFAEISWSELAASWGWYDQSHLIRDFRRYTGVSPRAYV